MKNMMKRFLSCFLAVQMVLQLTGCGAAAWFGGTRAQDDYYEYINEDFLEDMELSEKDAHWDWFSELTAVTDEEMEEIIKSVSASGAAFEKGSSEQKIRDLYECVSDTQNREQTSLGPLKPHMDSIRNAQNIEEYVDALARLSGQFGFSSIVGGYDIMQDKADSSRYAVYMMYADTLIGKEYMEGKDTQDYVDMYFDYVKDMFCAFGMPEEEARHSSDSVETLLRDICASTMNAEQMYDPSLTYNVYTAEELQQLFTNVNVEQMLRTLRIDGQDRYIVMDVGQAEKVNSLLVEENLQALKDYSTFVMLNDTAKYGDQEFFKLYEQMTNALYGITESWGDEENWMHLTQELLPWDFGMMYVEEHFSLEDKEAVEQIIDRILKEYENVIRNQDWMSEATKEKAICKLQTMQIKIGYPEQWPEEKDMMQVTPVSEGGSLMSNLLTSMEVSIKYKLQRLDGPVDRSLWNTAPQTVNAYYEPSNNEIIFPAAILQAPFYDHENSEGANLGGIGYVIAHEVSHAFDASGALYDEYGNYQEWWTEEEWEAYQKLSQSIVAYYDKYEMIGTNVNGELTLSENIADLGAATCIVSIIGEDEEALKDAFSQMAYNWACQDTAEYALYLLNMDTHSPNKIRVNAVLSSCDEFYEVYHVKEKDGMYIAPEDRVGIWK